jgi:hypothetical protein
VVQVYGPVRDEGTRAGREVGQGKHSEVESSSIRWRCHSHRRGKEGHDARQGTRGMWRHMQTAIRMATMMWPTVRLRGEDSISWAVDPRVLFFKLYEVCVDFPICKMEVQLYRSSFL